jgi:hypothetical protein
MQSPPRRLPRTTPETAPGASPGTPRPSHLGLRPEGKAADLWELLLQVLEILEERLESSRESFSGIARAESASYASYSHPSLLNRPEYHGAIYCPKLHPCQVCTCDLHMMPPCPPRS